MNKYTIVAFPDGFERRALSPQDATTVNMLVFAEILREESYTLNPHWKNPNKLLDFTAKLVHGETILDTKSLQAKLNLW